MSKRELNSLIREGKVVTASRLQSGERTQVQQDTVIMMDDATVDPQELQQKLTAAAEELQSVRADYERQLKQTRDMAERAKEYGKDQRRQVQELEQELEEETQRRKGVEK